MKDKKLNIGHVKNSLNAQKFGAIKHLKRFREILISCPEVKKKYIKFSKNNEFELKYFIELTINGLEKIEYSSNDIE